MVATVGVAAMALAAGFVLASGFGDGGRDASVDPANWSESSAGDVADHALARGESGGVSWTLDTEEPDGGTGVCLVVKDGRGRRGSGGMCIEDDSFDQFPAREFLPSFTSSLSGEDGPELLVVVAPHSTDEVVLVRGDSLGEIISSRQEGEDIARRAGERIHADRSWTRGLGQTDDEPLQLFVEVLSAEQASELGAVRAG